MLTHASKNEAFWLLKNVPNFCLTAIILGVHRNYFSSIQLCSSGGDGSQPEQSSLKKKKAMNNNIKNKHGL